MFALVVMVLAFSPQRGWTGLPQTPTGKTLSIDVRFDAEFLAIAWRLSL
jgi:hypothetical protein